MGQEELPKAPQAPITCCLLQRPSWPPWPPSRAINRPHRCCKEHTAPRWVRAFWSASNRGHVPHHHWEPPANPGLRGHSTRAAGRNLCSLPATDALHPLKWFTKAKQRPFMTPALDMKVVFQRLYIKRRCSHTHWSFRKLPAEPGAAMEVCSPHTQPLNVQPHPWQNHGLSLPDFKGME